MKQFIRIALVVLAILMNTTVFGIEEKSEGGDLRITVVYNNVPHAAGLTTGWGFAAVIETEGKRILFDTGGDSRVLLSNMERLGIDPKDIEAVILSHNHSDHTGGLNGLLKRNADVTVYLPQSFPASFRHKVERHGARVETVAGPRRLFDDIHSTGEMGMSIKEQALIIDTRKGLVVITGCAHPHVGEIAAAARRYMQKEIYLLMGGFHLLANTDTKVREIINNLKLLGVKKIAPSHCTGEKAIALFREAWGKDFIEGGCGAIIEVSP